MEYKLIASDLDGTLLQSDGKVSPENRQAIAALRDMGVEFVPASGRAFYEMPVELRESPLIRYYIASDGAVVYDKHTGETWELPMPKNVGHWVLDTIYSYKNCMMLHADTHSYMDLEQQDRAVYAGFNMSKRWIDFVYAMDKMMPNFREFAYGLDSIQSICAFFQTEEDLQDCIARLESHPELLVAQSDAFNLEVFHKTAGKGNALKLLADKLDIPIAATIAMGDSTNDTTMVVAAGLGVAMENAVPALKETADTVICHYRDHGVKFLLEHYFK